MFICFFYMIYNIVPGMENSVIANLLARALSGMRIHHGQGYGVYFVQRGIEIVILPAGGNKSTQSKGIKTGLEIARQIQW